MELDPNSIDSSDGFSEPVYFKEGFPVGTRTATVAHVSWLDSEPLLIVAILYTIGHVDSLLGSPLPSGH